MFLQQSQNSQICPLYKKEDKSSPEITDRSTY